MSLLSFISFLVPLVSKVRALSFPPLVPLNLSFFLLEGKICSLHLLIAPVSGSMVLFSITASPERFRFPPTSPAFFWDALTEPSAFPFLTLHLSQKVLFLTPFSRLYVNLRDAMDHFFCLRGTFPLLQNCSFMVFLALLSLVSLLK